MPEVGASTRTLSNLGTEVGEAPQTGNSPVAHTKFNRVDFPSNVT